jgi:hypothetical protein
MPESIDLSLTPEEVSLLSQHLEYYRLLESVNGGRCVQANKERYSFIRALWAKIS